MLFLVIESNSRRSLIQLKISMFLPLLICIFVPIYTAEISNTTKIIEVFGKPIDFTTYEELEQDWKTCQVTCINDESCVMIYEVSESSCQLFQFGQISLVERMLYGGNKVAFKIEISENSCPTTNPIISSSPISDYRIIDGLLYTTTLSYDSENWRLNYRTTSCRGNTTLFLRNTTPVSIGLFMFNSPYCNNQAQGSALCKTNNGTLTGPANSNEYTLIQALSKASYNTSNQGKYKYLTYWIDGTSLPGKYNYSFEDVTHNGITSYQWAVGTPSNIGTGYCLYNPNALGYYISDISCTVTQCCDPICWRGALCQVAPSFQVF